MVELLNPLFEIYSYDGSSEPNSYPIENVLDTNLKTFHCSKLGTNFCLIMKTKNDEPVTITNVVVHKAPGCTRPIKSGVLFVTDHLQEGECEALVEGYDENFEHPDGYFYFVIKDDEKFVDHRFESWGQRTGKFVVIKFFDVHRVMQLDDEDNVDVGTIGIVGFSEPRSEEEFRYYCIPEELGLFPGEWDEEVEAVRSAWEPWVQALINVGCTQAGILWNDERETNFKPVLIAHSAGFRVTRKEAERINDYFDEQVLHLKLGGEQYLALLRPHHLDANYFCARKNNTEGFTVAQSKTLLLVCEYSTPYPGKINLNILQIRQQLLDCGL